MCEVVCQIVQKKLEEKRIEEEQAAKAQNWKILACCDDDDDYNSAITPNEPVDSLSIGDKHLNTIPATKLDEFIKSCVENLVPNPSEFEGENGCDVHACFTTFSNILFEADYESDSNDYQSCSNEDFPEEIFSNPLFEEEIIHMKIDQHHLDAEEFEGENGCDVHACFTTFSNILFEADYESDSNDYQSCSNEDFPEEIFSNPLFEEEIIHMKIDQHHLDAESDLIESMLNHDFSIIPSSLKIDSLLDEFVGELTLLKSIPLGIDKTDCHPKNEIRLIERLLYDNSLPRPPKEFVSKNSYDEIESFSPSPIPIEDSDYLMEEIDLSCTPDDPMPSSIKDNDDDDFSKRDILIHKELFDNYSLLFPVNESFYFDIPLFSRPPAKPPDGNIEILNIKMMGDISDQKFVQYSQKLEDSCQRILSSKSSYPQLQLGIMYPNLID
nr:hypothetical protein [Tanacetum cinerariifolium]